MQLTYTNKQSEHNTKCHDDSHRYPTHNTMHAKPNLVIKHKTTCANHIKKSTLHNLYRASLWISTLNIFAAALTPPMLKTVGYKDINIIDATSAMALGSVIFWGAITLALSRPSVKIFLMKCPSIKEHLPQAFQNGALFFAINALICAGIGAAAIDLSQAVSPSFGTYLS